MNKPVIISIVVSVLLVGGAFWLAARSSRSGQRNGHHRGRRAIRGYFRKRRLLAADRHGESRRADGPAYENKRHIRLLCELGHPEALVPKISSAVGDGRNTYIGRAGGRHDA